MKYISIKIKGNLISVIADIREKISAKFAEYLGVKDYDLPSVFLIETKGYLKKYKMEGEINEKNIMKFIYDWNNKNINPYYKSAKEPKNNNGDVIEIVGNNFKDKVIYNDKEAFVLFYTPNCLYCKVLFPKYEKLAKKFKENNNKIIFAKINMADNEIENEDILSFPCLKFYSGNKKDKKGIEYDGDRSIEDLTQFIKINAYNKIIFDDEKKNDKKDKISDL